MVTSLYTADIKLNKTDKDYHKCLIINNGSGVLIVNRGLFSISFEDQITAFKGDVEIINKKHIGDISL